MTIRLLKSWGVNRAGTVIDTFPAGVCVELVRRRFAEVVKENGTVTDPVSRTVTPTLKAPGRKRSFTPIPKPRATPAPAPAENGRDTTTISPAPPKQKVPAPALLVGDPEERGWRTIYEEGR